MLSLLYLVDSAFHVGLSPSTPASLMPSEDNSMLSAQTLPKPARLQMLSQSPSKPAHFQMLAVSGPNPPPTNPERCVLSCHHHEIS
jgi:hypothetical protein